MFGKCWATLFAHDQQVQIALSNHLPSYSHVRYEWTTAAGQCNGSAWIGSVGIGFIASSGAFCRTLCLGLSGTRFLVFKVENQLLGLHFPVYLYFRELISVIIAPPIAPITSSDLVSVIRRKDYTTLCWPFKNDCTILYARTFSGN